MRFFDGVETNPTPTPTTSKSQKWISVLLLVFNAFVAAEECRQDRLAADTRRGSPFEQVMAQAGLKIPTLEQALAHLMGNAEEAKLAASMIADSPDPVNLLERLVKRFAADAATNASAPTAEPSPPPAAGGTIGPPAASGSGEPSPQAAASAPPRADRTCDPNPPAVASNRTDTPPAAPPAAELRWDRPDFDRLAREAITAADAAGSVPISSSGEPAPPAAELRWDRPDFDRLAREAIRAADAAGSARTAANDTSQPRSGPEPEPKAHVDVAATTEPSSASTRPSLVGAVRRQLEALRRRMDAHEAELDARLARAEAELAALRDDIRQRSRPALVVVSPPRDEAIVSPVEPEVRRPLEIVDTDARVESSLADSAGAALAPEGEGPPSPPRVATQQEPTTSVEIVDAGPTRVESLLDSAVTAPAPASEGSPSPPRAAPPQEPESRREGAEIDAPLPTSASDEEFAEALGIVTEFGAEIDARHQHGLDRVSAVEHEAQVLRAELRGETTERAAERRGETTERAAERALS